MIFDTPPRKLLIVKPSAIGDVVHTLPIYNLIRRHWPSTEISWLVTPMCAGIIEGLPGLNVIRFDRQELGSAWRSPRAFFQLFRFARTLRNERFDLVIDLQGLFRSAWLAWQTRAQVRIGFSSARELAPLFYTHRVPIRTIECHAIDRYLAILEYLGIPTSPIEYPFPTTAEDERHIETLLKDVPERIAILLPGTNWPTKRWPAEYFAQLVPRLWREHHLAAVLAGSPGDIPLAEKIVQAYASSRTDSKADTAPPPINLTGRTTLLQLVELLRRGAIVVANDSGPMHIASALNRPLIALFGPTNPIRTGPYRRLDTVVRLDIACSPCYSRTCSHHSCMKLLKPERLLLLPVDPHS